MKVGLHQPLPVVHRAASPAARERSDPVDVVSVAARTLRDSTDALTEECHVEQALSELATAPVTDRALRAVVRLAAAAWQRSRHSISSELVDLMTVTGESYEADQARELFATPPDPQQQQRLQKLTESSLELVQRWGVPLDASALQEQPFRLTAHEGRVFVEPCGELPSELLEVSPQQLFRRGDLRQPLKLPPNPAIDALADLEPAQFEQVLKELFLRANPTGDCRALAALVEVLREPELKARLEPHRELLCGLGQRLQEQDRLPWEETASELVAGYYDALLGLGVGPAETRAVQELALSGNYRMEYLVGSLCGKYPELSEPVGETVAAARPPLDGLSIRQMLAGAMGAWKPDQEATAWMAGELGKGGLSSSGVTHCRSFTSRVLERLEDFPGLADRVPSGSGTLREAARAMLSEPLFSSDTSDKCFQRGTCQADDLTRLALGGPGRTTSLTWLDQSWDEDTARQKASLFGAAAAQAVSGDKELEGQLKALDSVPPVYQEAFDQLLAERDGLMLALDQAETGRLVDLGLAGKMVQAPSDLPAPVRRRARDRFEALLKQRQEQDPVVQALAKIQDFGVLRRLAQLGPDEELLGPDILRLAERPEAVRKVDLLLESRPLFAAAEPGSNRAAWQTFTRLLDTYEPDAVLEVRDELVAAAGSSRPEELLKRFEEALALGRPLAASLHVLRLAEARSTPGTVELVENGVDVDGFFVESRSAW